jgi:molybdopterin/thiamine biosynthesis adenylyltransferase
MLSDEQTQRYSRQILLKEIGAKGTLRLLKSCVAIVGLGGLGCIAAQMLASVGIGKLKLIDGDSVDLSNLSRQILHTSGDLEKSKVMSAQEKISKINPDVKIEIFDKFLTKENIASVLSGSNYVIDGSDNLAVKFLINDYCVVNNIPFTIAGAVQFYGQIISVIPKKTVCYRCIFRDPDNFQNEATCSAVGVLATVPNFAGILEANECIKYLVGKIPNFINRVFSFDLFQGAFDTIELKQEPNCDLCKAERSEDIFKKNEYKPINPECNIREKA